MDDYAGLSDNIFGKSYGNVIVNGQISFNGTAAMAKFRLKAILVVDRIRCKDPRAIQGSVARRFRALQAALRE